MGKMEEMSRLPYWGRPERSLVADYHLLAARIHWRHGSPAQSVQAVARAVISRPIILARPLKRLLHRLRIGARLGRSCAWGSRRARLASVQVRRRRRPVEES
jgi:hypothetical protein